MKTFRIYVHSDRSRPIADKVGFCWPVFLTGPLWFVRNRMWISFLLPALMLSAITTENGASASQLNKVVGVAVGLSPEQVQQRSTFRIPWQLIAVGENQRRTGSAIINTPHQVRYEDANLRFTLPEAGHKPSMPTMLSVSRDSVVIVSASVLGEYVDLSSAIAASRKLLSEFQEQHFGYRPEKPGRHSRFYLARANPYATPPAPSAVSSFEELEQAFLDSRIYVQEAVVFFLEKGELSVELRMTNMRRRHTEARRHAGKYMRVAERAKREADVHSKDSLQREPAYYLELSVARALHGEFTAGARVEVSREHHWAQGATGTVTEPPARVRKISGDWSGVSRVVQGVNGPLTFYWVTFDVPQTDSEGHGPFFGAEIYAGYLRRSPKAPAHISRIAEQDVEAVWYENKQLGLKVEFKAFLKR